MPRRKTLRTKLKACCRLLRSLTLSKSVADQPNELAERKGGIRNIRTVPILAE